MIAIAASGLSALIARKRRRSISIAVRPLGRWEGTVIDGSLLVYASKVVISSSCERDQSVRMHLCARFALTRLIERNELKVFAETDSGVHEHGSVVHEHGSGVRGDEGVAGKVLNAHRRDLIRCDQCGPVKAGRRAEPSLDTGHRTDR
ncbi:MAG TPA: hypothetical protein VHX38_28955 [Pseudonocardiaceae bacterium]|nr:hypothetical protein [Pseudonocardiaceae bacterium]